MSGSKVDYVWHTLDDVLVITDLNRGGRSVTNGIHAVLAEIGAELVGGWDVVNHVIYRDSCGIYDGVVINAQGEFKGFFSIGEKSEEAAVRRLKTSGGNGNETRTF